MEIDLAAERAAATATAELVDQLRESAESTRRFPGSKPMDPLMDLVIHAQDIARPLGTPYRSPAAVVAASLAYVAANKLMGGPKRRRRRAARLRPTPGGRWGTVRSFAAPTRTCCWSPRAARPAWPPSRARDGWSCQRDWRVGNGSLTPCARPIIDRD